MNSTNIGIDLAKNVLEVYVEDGANQTRKRTRLSRKKILPWFANRASALIAQYVKPWVQTNKSDQADARAICRAVQKPGMRFVGLASEAQQAMQAIHRYMSNRTALINQTRGILLEYDGCPGNSSS